MKVFLGKIKFKNSYKKNLCCIQNYLFSWNKNIYFLIAWIIEKINLITIRQF